MKIEVISIPIGNIDIEGRHRKNLGDIEKLADSISDIGLIHPVVVKHSNGRYKLISGERRLSAFRLLQSQKGGGDYLHIPAHIAENMNDIYTCMKAERDENVCREDFAPSEAVAMGRDIEEEERIEAKKRQGTRTDLEHSGNLPECSRGDTRDKVGEAVGLSGSTYEAAKSIVEKADEQPEIFGDLVNMMDNKSVNAAVKEKKKREREEEEKTLTLNYETLQEDDKYSVYFHDITAGVPDVIPSSSVDVIITDPPYPKEYLYLYSSLSSFAYDALKEGGSLIVMCGQSYFPEVIKRLTEKMNYQWVVAYLTPGGQSSQMWQRKVNTFWKPVIWLVKGTYSGSWVGDVAKSEPNDNDKRFHEWGQSESGMLDLVTRFSKPGDLIVDPFCGAGTTGVVSIAFNRRFIGLDNDKNSIRKTKARIWEVINGSTNS